MHNKNLDVLHTIYVGWAVYEYSRENTLETTKLCPPGSFELPLKKGDS